jgi:hypothetical protein
MVSVSEKEERVPIANPRRVPSLCVKIYATLHDHFDIARGFEKVMRGHEIDYVGYGERVIPAQLSVH